jgi:cell shape-determining protein MreC
MLRTSQKIQLILLILLILSIVSFVTLGMGSPITYAISIITAFAGGVYIAAEAAARFLFEFLATYLSANEEIQSITGKILDLNVTNESIKNIMEKIEREPAQKENNENNS